LNFKIYADETLDSDKRKINMIYIDFLFNMCINLISSVHFLTLIFVRGLNISVFTHFVIGKTAFSAVQKLYSDIYRFVKFRAFMENLEKDFPLIMFRVANNDE